MKRHFLLLALVLPMMLGAQKWEIGMDMPIYFVDGVVNESNEAIVVGYNRYDMEDDDRFYPSLFKIKDDGEYEMFTYKDEYENVRFMNIAQLADGGYFVSGIEYVGSNGNNKICDIHIFTFDENLEIVKHEHISPEAGYYFGVHQDVIVDEGNVIMVSSTLGDDFVCFKPTFFMFNSEAELLTTKYPAAENGINDYSNLNVDRVQLRKCPDGSGYVMIARFTGSGMKLMKYSNEFKFESYSDPEHPEYMGSSLYNSYEANSDLWLSDEDMMLFGTYLNYREDNDHDEIVISDVNIDGTVNKYEVISSDTCHSAFLGNNAMSYVNDSTIYGGYHSYSSAVIPFHTQICLFTRDMEILGTLTVKDRLGYSDKSLLTYENGDVLLLGSINRFEPQQVTEASITRFSRNDFITSTLDVNEVSDDEIANMVYPNPTSGELNIDIRGIDTDRENRIRIIDMNGRVLTSRIIRGSGNVLTMDVSSLDAGVYVYEVFNAEGTISKGRFVKK